MAFSEGVNNIQLPVLLVGLSNGNALLTLFTW